MSFIINPYSFGFNPLSLSPALWLSDTGSDPSVWPDLSGNGRNATQSNASQQPAIATSGINGRQVRRFDGGDMLSGSRILTASNFSCFMVMKGSPQSSKVLLAQRSHPNANLGRLEFIATDELAPNQVHRMFFNNGTGYNIKATTVSLNNSFRMIYTQNDSAGTMHCRVDGGSAEGSVSGQTLTPENVPYSVGGLIDLSRTFTGDIAEILVFPTALSTTDRQAVESYLRNKWGTPPAPTIPLSLSPALWLSDTGSDASVWPDLSGNGRNATQSDAAKRPAIVTGALNGRQVRRFDGVNDCFSHPLSIGANPCSVFIVAKRNGGTNLQHLFAAQAPNTGLSAYVMARSVASPNWHTYFQAQQTSSYSLDGQWRSIALIVNSGTSIAMITDGNVQNFSPSGYFTDGIDRRWIGAENGSIPFIGDIAEILVFPTALSTSNRQAVESYLRNKWGTP